MMGVWERTVVIVRKDENLTKSHVRYLESRLIKMAQDARRANLTNDTAPEPASLPEPDVADMEFSRGRARALARALPRESPVFDLCKVGAVATAQEIDGHRPAVHAVHARSGGG